MSGFEPPVGRRSYIEQGFVGPTRQNQIPRPPIKHFSSGNSLDGLPLPPPPASQGTASSQASSNGSSGGGVFSSFFRKRSNPPTTTSSSESAPSASAPAGYAPGPPQNGGTSTPPRTTQPSHPRRLSSRELAPINGASSGTSSSHEVLVDPYSMPRESIESKPVPPLPSPTNHKQSPSTSSVASSATATPSRPRPLHPELRSLMSLNAAHAQKIYFSGPLARCNERSADGGRVSRDGDWHDVWGQIGGMSFSIWDMKAVEEAARNGTQAPPSYINITDLSVRLAPDVTAPGPNPPSLPKTYRNIFTINTAGQNLIAFSCPDRDQLTSWVAALRLAVWEKGRLEEIYTGHLLRMTLTDTTTGRFKEPRTTLVKGRLEGWVKVRVAGQIQWKSVWAVVTSRDSEPHSASSVHEADRPMSPTSTVPKRSRMSSIFGVGGSSVPDVTVPPPSTSSSSTLTLYAGNKSKDRKTPLLTLTDVAQVFSVFPDRVELINISTIIKMEGRFAGGTPEFMGPNAPPGHDSGKIVAPIREGWMLLMPDVEEKAVAPMEMLKWIVALHDAFELYGRPGGYSWDPFDERSPMFAYPIGEHKDDLFLQRDDAERLDPRIDRMSVVRDGLMAMLRKKLAERPPPRPQKPMGPTTTPAARPMSSSSSHSSSPLRLPPLDFETPTSTPSTADSSTFTTPLGSSAGVSIRSPLPPISEQRSTSPHEEEPRSGTPPPKLEMPRASSPTRISFSDIGHDLDVGSPGAEGTPTPPAVSSRAEATTVVTSPVLPAKVSPNSSTPTSPQVKLQSPLQPSDQGLPLQSVLSDRFPSSFAASSAAVPAPTSPPIQPSRPPLPTPPSVKERRMSEESYFNVNPPSRPASRSRLSFVSTPHGDSTPGTNAPPSPEFARPTSLALGGMKGSSESLRGTALAMMNTSPLHVKSASTSPSRSTARPQSPLQQSQSYISSIAGSIPAGTETKISPPNTSQIGSPSLERRSAEGAPAHAASPRFMGVQLRDPGSPSSPAPRVLSQSPISFLPPTPPVVPHQSPDLRRVTRDASNSGSSSGSGSGGPTTVGHLPGAQSPRVLDPNASRELPSLPGAATTNSNAPPPGNAFTSVPASSPPPPRSVPTYDYPFVPPSGEPGIVERLRRQIAEEEGFTDEAGAEYIARRLREGSTVGHSTDDEDESIQSSISGSGAFSESASRRVNTFDFDALDNALAAVSSPISATDPAQSPPVLSPTTNPIATPTQQLPRSAEYFPPSPIPPNPQMASNTQPESRPLDDEGLGMDALAALTFAESAPPVEASPPMTRATPRSAPVQSPPPANPRPPPSPANVPEAPRISEPQHFPSSFSTNKAAAERQAKAKANAAAFQAAAHKPGARTRAPRASANAWDTSDEEEEEEEEDDDEDGSDAEPDRGRPRPSAGIPPPPPIRAQQAPTLYAPQAQQPHSIAVSGSMAEFGQRRSDSPQISGDETLRRPRNLPSLPRGSHGPSGNSPLYEDSRRTYHDGPLQPPPRLRLDERSSSAERRHPSSSAAAPRGNIWRDVLEPGKGDSVGPNAQGNEPFVDLNESQTMTKAFAPGGLLQAGLQDKQDRSAKRQQEMARESGASYVHVPAKPPPPQSGLVGAITAHEREKKREGGMGAALTERERLRRQAEERQRKIDELQRQQLEYAQENGGMDMYGAGGATTPFGNPMMMNPMMMGNPMMMNPMMMGNPMMGGGLTPQFSGYQQPGWGMGGMAPSPQMQMMAAQQAAADAYRNAMMAFSQAGSVAGSEMGGPTAGNPGNPGMRAQSPMMWPGAGGIGNTMSMYGMPGPMTPQMTGQTWGMGMGMGGMPGMGMMGMQPPQPDYFNGMAGAPGSPGMRNSMFRTPDAQQQALQSTPSPAGAGNETPPAAPKS
ncbi:hypothetical protein DL93DRAFT_2229030 [Clavulina sp. PMI_390]|nr:hypothetical protein DL93DRAFT_2229030 [Clavulina sp. PMI_390]